MKEASKLDQVEDSAALTTGTTESVNPGSHPVPGEGGADSTAPGSGNVSFNAGLSTAERAGGAVAGK
jgi:hypothetical protein